MACAGHPNAFLDSWRKLRFKILFGALTLLRLTSIRPRDPLYSFGALHLPDSEPRHFATQGANWLWLAQDTQTLSSTLGASIGSESCSISSSIQNTPLTYASRVAEDVNPYDDSPNGFKIFLAAFRRGRRPRRPLPLAYEHSRLRFPLYNPLFMCYNIPNHNHRRQP